MGRVCECCMLAASTQLHQQPVGRKEGSGSRQRYQLCKGYVLVPQGSHKCSCACELGEHCMCALLVTSWATLCHQPSWCPRCRVPSSVWPCNTELSFTSGWTCKPNNPQQPWHTSYRFTQSINSPFVIGNNGRNATILVPTESKKKEIWLLICCKDSKMKGRKLKLSFTF